MNVAIFGCSHQNGSRKDKIWPNTSPGRVQNAIMSGSLSLNRKTPKRDSNLRRLLSYGCKLEVTLLIHLPNQFSRSRVRRMIRQAASRKEYPPINDAPGACKVTPWERWSRCYRRTVLVSVLSLLHIARNLIFLSLNFVRWRINSSPASRLSFQADEIFLIK